MAEAAKMLSTKNYEAARMLALKARDLFQQAAPEIAKEREAVLGNLMSYIQIEEEREALMKKRKARKEREEREERELEERLEGAAMAAMEAAAAAPGQKLPTKSTPASAGVAARGGGALPDLCILVDNGSSRAASTLGLRRIARQLGEAIGMPVVAASMAHADKAPLDELGGEAAGLLLKELRERCLQDAVGSVVVVPLFFGPTLAVTKKIPEALREVAAEKSVEAAAAFREASLRCCVRERESARARASGQERESSRHGLS
jgi:sirohydrochlorin ferrochelatase